LPTAAVTAAPVVPQRQIVAQQIDQHTGRAGCPAGLYGCRLCQSGPR
jgi:hypothetical protein